MFASKTCLTYAKPRWALIGLNQPWCTNDHITKNSHFLLVVSQWWPLWKLRRHTDSAYCSLYYENLGGIPTQFTAHSIMKTWEAYRLSLLLTLLWKLRRHTDSVYCSLYYAPHCLFWNNLRNSSKFSISVSAAEHLRGTHSDITRASWRLKSLAHSQLVLQLLQANKENFKRPYYWPFMSGNHRWFPSQRPEMQKGHGHEEGESIWAGVRGYLMVGFSLSLDPTHINITIDCTGVIEALYNSTWTRFPQVSPMSTATLQGHHLNKMINGKYNWDL